MNTHVLQANLAQQARAFCALTKPRVVSLIVFTAVIGMFLATPGMVALQPLVFGALGIALVAGAAAAINCLLERNIDALMPRTRARPLPRGELNSAEALAFLRAYLRLPFAWRFLGKQFLVVGVRAGAARD